MSSEAVTPDSGTGNMTEHNCRFEYCTAPRGECQNPE